MKKGKETDLYQPVKDFLTHRGFAVKAEINGIDVLAIKDELMLAVELKRTLSLALIYQAIERQQYSDIVYVAVPKHAIKKRQSFKRFSHLLRRLELGLLLVEDNHVFEAIAPKPYSTSHAKAKSKSKKTRVLHTFHSLQSEKNIGGTQGKTMTLYKEQVNAIIHVLNEHGPLSPKAIVTLTGIQKTASILQKNYSGYFKRISRGMYHLTDLGNEETIKN